MGSVRTAPEDREALYRSVAWHALAKLAGKEADRDILPAGAAYDVEGRFVGEVDGQPVALEVLGRLEVGDDTPTCSNVAASAEHVLALALALIPKTRRASFLDDIPQQFSAAGKLPPADPDLLNAAQQMLTSLRSRKSTVKRGVVHFDRTA